MKVRKMDGGIRKILTIRVGKLTGLEGGAELDFLITLPSRDGAVDRQFPANLKLKIVHLSRASNFKRVFWRASFVFDAISLESDTGVNKQKENSLFLLSPPSVAAAKIIVAQMPDFNEPDGKRSFSIPADILHVHRDLSAALAGIDEAAAAFWLELSGLRRLPALTQDTAWFEDIYHRMIANRSPTYRQIYAFASAHNRALKPLGGVFSQEVDCWLRGFQKTFQHSLDQRRKNEQRKLHHYRVIASQVVRCSPRVSFFMQSEESSASLLSSADVGFLSVRTLKKFIIEAAASARAPSR